MIYGYIYKRQGTDYILVSLPYSPKLTAGCTHCKEECIWEGRGGRFADLQKYLNTVAVVT